ncbi:terminase (plasmid) [Xenorhabdus sp. SF857]|uniref:terminase n=1 Tax=Xenorhabdus bakwenae TaxID=3026967 RepID=UPI002557DAF6|nr:terminase [Xenorhabdus sp. SF857]WFQ78160.1 terminase [Xenorhabdus sp. SF857]
MAGRHKKKGHAAITLDPRYLDFAASYRSRPLAFICDIIGMEPSFQQIEVINALTPVGARVSVASGHGTGKSHLTAALCLHFIITHPESLCMLTANSLDQVTNVIFSYIKRLWVKICQRQPWLEQYFVITAKSFYTKGYKGVWQIFGKTCSKGNEEGLAGQHRRDYMVVVDEASGVSDRAFEVLRGALTEENNKILLISQFTRPTGHFADSQTELAEQELYTALTLNSEQSPFVTVRFIREKRIEYGGINSPEYGIRVLGICPDNASGFLISRSMVDKGFNTVIEFADEWGWVATADVSGGEGRDSSVLNIGRVCGFGSERQIEIVRAIEAPADMDGVQFARFIHQETDGYTNITVGIDADGYGLTTAQECEKLGVNVARIHWGRPPHAHSVKQRFPKEKDYACVMLKEALDNGRIALCKGNTKLFEKKLQKQFVKIPYEFDELGRWRIFSKKQLRSEGIKSPDIFDATAFFWLVDYIPAGEQSYGQSESALVNAMALLGEMEMNAADKAIAVIKSGGVVECHLDDYPDVRRAIQSACGEWLDNGISIYAQIGMMEIERLDEFFKFYKYV